MRARLAKIHQRGEDGSLEPQMELEIPQDPEFEMGGGGLYGTVGDYLRFIRLILNRGRANGERVLRPETVDMMSRNQMGEIRVGELKTAIPPLSNDAEFFPGMPKSWGLSFMINDEEAPTGRSAGSLGWAGLANSFFWIDPAKGIGGAYLTQVLPFIDEKAFPALHRVRERGVRRARVRTERTSTSRRSVSGRIGSTDCGCEGSPAGTPGPAGERGRKG